MIQELSVYNPSRSIPARISRRLTQWNTIKPLGKTPSRPIVSFTFDDFPKSAADQGAQIIEDAGGRGTFYACTSFIGQRAPTGDQFEEADVRALLDSGHEIGAHTHTHLDCSKENIESIKTDIKENLARLSDLGANSIESFAYPYGETHPAVKRSLLGQFSTARGILAGHNGHSTDRMQLRAFELSKEDWTIDRAANAIKATATAPSWVVIFTHGITQSAEAYGTTPKALRELTKIAQGIGAEILTMKDAMLRLEASNDD